MTASFCVALAILGTLALACGAFAVIAYVDAEQKRRALTKTILERAIR